MAERALNAATTSEWWRSDFADPPALRSDVEHEIAPSSNALPFRALLAFTFVLVIAPQSLIPALAPLRLALLCAAAAIGACLWDRIARRGSPSIQAPEIRFAAALAAWILVTIPFSYWPGGSVALFLSVFAKSVAIFWVICNTVDSRERLRKVMLTLSLMSIPLALTAAWNYHTGVFVPNASRDLARIVGYTAPLTTNPNDLALMLNLILPLSVALLLSSRGVIRRILLLAAIALSVLGVLFTFSRGGFITLGATTLFLLVWRMKSSGLVPILGLLMAGALCLPFLPQGYLSHMGTLANFQSDMTGSAQERWNDMAAATRFVAGHPLVGAGIGMNTLALNEIRGTEWRMVHNVYLEYAADVGLPGLLLFLLLLWSSIRSAAAARRMDKDGSSEGEVSLLAGGIQASLLGFVIAAMVHPVSYNFYFFYLAGLAVAAKRIGIMRAAATEEA